MKQFLTFVILCLSSMSFGQSMKFHVDGTIKNSSLAKPEAGITVELIQNGSSLGQSVSGSNGKYDLNGSVDLSKPFKVVFRKDGFYSKTIAFDYTKVNPEDLPAGDLNPWKNSSTDMYSKSIPADLSFLETEPVAKFGNGADPNIVNSYSTSVKNKIDKLLLEAEQKKTADEAKYQAAVSAADGFYAQKKYAEALAKYEEANSIKPKEPHPITRINELDDLISAQKKEDLANQQADSEYLNLINAANTLRDQKKYDLAIAKYKEALQKKDEQYPKDQIAGIENQAKYAEAIKSADMFYNQKSYKAAKDKYLLASQLSPSEEYPKTRLSDIEKKMNEQSASQEKKKKYDEAMTAADALFQEKKYEEAKAKYTEALVYEPASTSAESQITECNKFLAEIAKEKEKQAKIVKLLADGGTLLSGNKLNEAKAKFNEVLVLDNVNAEAKTKLEEIAEKEKNAAALAEMEAKFAKLVNEGDLAAKTNKFADAKSKYEEALKLKTDAPTQTKLDGVNKKLDDLSSLAEKKQKFDQTMADADVLFKEEKWAEAKEKYNEASSIDNAALVPKEKIKLCDAKLLALTKEKEKADKIKALLAEGNSLFSVEKWNDSKAKYIEVQNLDPTNAEAKLKIDEINKRLNDAANLAAQEAKFNKLVSEGDAAVKTLKYEDAIAKYTAALNIKNDTAVQEKIDGVNAKLKELAEKESSEQQFQRLKAEGMKLAADQKWTEARSTLVEAQTIKADAAISAKIKEIDDRLSADAALVKAEKEYQDILAAAQAKESANDIDGAITKYKAASEKRPGESLPKEKIAALEALKLNSLKQKEIDAKYSAFMKKGDELFKKDLYLDAIQQYNQANTLKPEEPEPVEKAKLAQQKEEDKGSEDKKNYEKMIAGINKAIGENDLVRGKELVDRAKNYNKQFSIMPNDTRPDDLLKQILEIEQAEKNYVAKMKEAETLAASKDYTKAIEAFDAARKIKPTETKPAQRIEELTALINDLQTKEVKEKLYLDHMAKGVLNQNAKSYEQALSHYQDALSVKPGDIVATNKINEMQQLIDDLANKNKSQLERKNQFDALIAMADQQFAGSTFSEAKENYQKALELDNGSQYAKTQITECERQLKIAQGNQNMLAYQAVLKEADDFFDIKSYDKAREKYNDALAMRSTEAYPRKRLDEIDNILNPIVVKSSALEPLGDPFDNSIIDGYAALVKADIERKNLNPNSIVRTVDNINEKADEMTDQKTQEQLVTTHEIYLLRNRIGESDQEADLNREATVKELRNGETARNIQETDDMLFEHAENLRTQESLTGVIISTELDFKERDQAHLDNTEEIKAINTSYADEIVARSTQEATSNIGADQTLSVVKGNLNNKDLENKEVRQETDLMVNEILVKSQDLQSELTTKKQDQLLETKGGIEVVTEAVEKKNTVDGKQPASNKEELKIMEAQVQGIDVVRSDVQKNNSNSINKGVDGINLSIEKGNIERDLDRQATDKTLRGSAKELEELAIANYSKETIKYLENQNSIKNEMVKNTGVDDIAAEKHSLNVKEINIVDQKALIKTNENALSDDEERLKTRSEVHNANTSAELSAATSNKKQEENSSKLTDMNKTLESGKTNMEASQKDKNNNTQTQLNKIDTKQPEKVRVANSLGQDYPEGVSQESFTQSDENGLMTAIITRRIVVIEGQGNVYVRTQTLNAITYTKNGQPTTEYTWQRETQGGNLVKHY